MGRQYKNYRKRWTDEQVNYLKMNWGKVQVNTIARRLGKNAASIYAKANRLGLGKSFEYAGFVSLSQLAESLKLDIGTIYSYADKFGMPYVFKTMNHKIVKSIMIDEFYEWAEENTNLVDCTTIPSGYFGPEPDWLKTMRRNKYTTNATNEIIRQHEWTSLDTSKLRVFTMSGKYTLAQLAEKLDRTEIAINIKLSKMGMLHHVVLPERCTWSLEEEQLLLVYVKEFARKTRLCDWTKVAKALGKNENSCRKKYAYIQRRKDGPKRIAWDNVSKDKLNSLVQGYVLQKCEIDWTYISEELDRTVNACKSQHNRLRA